MTINSSPAFKCLDESVSPVKVNSPVVPKEVKLILLVWPESLISLPDISRSPVKSVTVAAVKVMVLASVKVILAMPSDPWISLPLIRISSPRVSKPEIEAVPPTSSKVLVSVPALMPNLELAPVSSRLLEPEALTNLKLLEEVKTLATSKLLEKEAPPLKVQLPVTVSFCDKEAGPPAPQSSLKTPSEAVLVKVKWEAS